VDDVIVLPFDVKTVTEPLEASGEVAFVETVLDVEPGPDEAVEPDAAAEPDVAPELDVAVGPDVAVGELDAAEELTGALVLAGVELCDGAADPEVREELGKWPTKNCMLCPVLFGSEHILVRVVESLNATVAEAALVQLQYAPGWRVEGFPSCEQIAHSLVPSQSVRATQGWSTTGSVNSLSPTWA
jgi:hypothetical protein